MADSTNQDGKLFVCATAQNSDLDAAGFEALTWVEIGRIVTMPSIGVEENVVTQNYVNTDMSQDQKGFKSGVDTEILVGKDHTDAGQDALFAGSLTKNRYAFKREYTDSPNAATTTNTVTYFRALIKQRIDNGGGGEDFENYTYPIKLTGQVPVTVDPEAI